MDASGTRSNQQQSSMMARKGGMSIHTLNNEVNEPRINYHLPKIVKGEAPSALHLKILNQ